MTSTRSTLFFSLAIVCLLVLLAARLMVDRATSESTSTNANTNASATNSQAVTGDPLVTVVPQDVRAGTPQPLSSDPQIGAAQPTVTIVEFGDFECEACAVMAEVFARLVVNYPNDVRVVWKDFPLPKEHLFSETAALAARCAQDQEAFWEYHDALFAQQKSFVQSPWLDIAESVGLDTSEFSSCLQTKEKKSLVVQGYFIARTFDLQETPAYYINGTLYTGSTTYEELNALVAAEIAKTTQ